MAVKLLFYKFDLFHSEVKGQDQLLEQKTWNMLDFQGFSWWLNQDKLFFNIWVSLGYATGASR